MHARTGFPVHRLLMPVLAAWSLAAGSAALAQGYSYTVVAERTASSRFTQLGFPTLNNYGEVVFAARRAGGSGIYKYTELSGAPQLVTIYEDNVDRFLNDTLFATPAIADDGWVFFQLDATQVLAGDGTAAPAVVASEAFGIAFADRVGLACRFPELVSRGTDGSGRALIACVVSDPGDFMYSGRGTYLGRGGPLERVCDTGLNIPGGVPQLCFNSRTSSVQRHAVAGNGTVAGLMTAVDEQFIPYDVLGRSSAAGVEALLDRQVHTTVTAFPDFNNRDVAVNSFGRVAYSAFDTASGFTRVYTIDAAGQPTLRSDTFRFARYPSLNDAGALVFMNRSGSEPATVWSGLAAPYTRVVGMGDLLPGYASAVSQVDIRAPALNASGQIAFLAQLADGTVVLARAEPGNSSPVVTEPLDGFAPEGQRFSLQMSANDAENDVPFTWSLSVAPAPANPNAPPLGFSISIDGEIYGTPGPGTAGNIYQLTVTARDARNAVSAPVQFELMITSAAPLQRTPFSATANSASNTIDLAWGNPSGDSATGIRIFGGRQDQGVGYLDSVPAGTTSYAFAPTEPGVVYCFYVVAVSDDLLESPRSVLRCATSPQLRIENLQTTVTGRTAEVTWTTNLAALVSLSLSPDDPSVTTELVNSLALTSFRLTIAGLRPQTTYTLQIRAQSTPGSRLEAQTEVSFMAAANAPARPTLQVRFVPPLDLDTFSYGQFRVVITNTSNQTLRNVRIVRELTVLHVSNAANPEVDGECVSDPQQPFTTCPLMDSDVDLIAELRSGERQEVGLTFPFHGFNDAWQSQLARGNLISAFLGLTHDGLTGPTVYGVLLPGSAAP